MYGRVSVADASAFELTSIDVQVEACQSFIGSQQALGWVAIEPSYADHGYSRSNLNRPALQALLAVMAEQKVDVVVVHRLDRLSRSIGDLCALVLGDQFPPATVVRQDHRLDAIGIDPMRPQTPWAETRGQARPLWHQGTRIIPALSL